jgi:hypothetical protein
LRLRKEEQMQRELQQLILQAHEAELRDKFHLTDEQIKIKAGEDEDESIAGIIQFGFKQVFMFSLLSLFSGVGR